MSRKARTQQERRSATTQVVLENATNLFGSRGYQATSLEDIAEASGTTIRPVYHYFGNKLNLFLAVTESMESLLFKALFDIESTKASKVVLADYWNTFMQYSRDPKFRQIVLIDAPAVLGRERWKNSPVVERAIDVLCTMLPGMHSETRLLVARMAVAALTEAAMSLAEPGNTNKEKAIEEVSALFSLSLLSLGKP
ncbi:MAG: helix-turn-helix domain-containing protein [Gammaproteobacteria bacterium]